MLKLLQFALLASALMISSMPSSYAEKQDGFECRFSLSQGQRSIRYFSLTPEVYQCLKYLNHRDLSIVNSNQQPVPFKLSYPGSTVDKKRYNRTLTFYQEPSASAYKTGDQIRRIAQLTGTRSGNETDTQWQDKNIYYSSIIIEQQQDSNQLQSITINIDDGYDAVNATVVLESSNDLQNWTTTLAPHHLLFLNGKNKTLTNNRLKLASYRKAKYFRLAVLSNIEKFTQKISAIEGEYQKIKYETQELSWFKPSRFSPQADPNEWVVDLPNLIPVTRMRFTLADDIVFYQGSIYMEPYTNPEVEQSSRKLRGEGRKKLKNLLKKGIKSSSPSKAGSRSWRYISGFNQYRIKTENGSLLSSDISLNSVQSKRYLLKFSQPQNLQQNQLPLLELGWQAPVITFITQGSGPFYLLAGNTQIPQKISFPSQISSLDKNTELVNLIGTNTISNESTASSDEQAMDMQTNWGKILLWLVLLSGLVIMSIMAYQLVRKMKEQKEA